MIIVQIKGGLGNQMFQYALAKKMSLKNKTSLLMDDYTKKAGIQRSYDLSLFNTTGRRILPIELNILELKNKLAKKFKNLKGIGYTIVKEKDEYFDASIFELKNNLYLDGYWQSFKYFNDIRETIVNDFKLKSNPDKYNQEMISKIQNSNSVAIHVRRGDYVADANTNKYHGTCSLEYYQKCIADIKSKIKDPHFFIFSDDPEWAKENIKTDAKTTVSTNPPEKGPEDMRLLYNCKHFIIANSTFSLWGAWLSEYNQKIVYAPSRWFQDSERTGKDIVPEEWIKI